MKLSNVLITTGAVLLLAVILLGNYAIWTNVPRPTDRWEGVLMLDGVVAICLFAGGAIAKIYDR